MKKFDFTLGRILDYRQSLLEKERNSLMQLFSQKNAVEQRIENYERDYADASRQLVAATAKGTTVVELQRMNVRLDALRRAIEDAKIALAETEKRIENQRDVVKEVMQQVTGLEKLRDKQREEYDYSQRKEEEERILELVSSKIARRMAESPV